MFDTFKYLKIECQYEALQAEYNVLKSNSKDFFDYMNDNFPDEVASYFEKNEKEGK